MKTHKTYQKMAELLGDRTQRKIGNNTYLIRQIPSNEIFVRLHNTNILRFWPDGTVTVNSGGWRTPTTKRRINRWLPEPWMVLQIAGTWYIKTKKDDVSKWTPSQCEMFEFHDGDVIKT